MWLPALKALIKSQHLTGGQTVLQQVNEKEQANIAATAGSELVQGDYYDKLVTDHLRCL
jgi:EAL domain-containing protein (putative c-di-GMP-specific phosphodiesterase class I)